MKSRFSTRHRTVWCDLVDKEKWSLSSLWCYEVPKNLLTQHYVHKYVLWPWCCAIMTSKWPAHWKMMLTLFDPKFEKVLVRTRENGDIWKRWRTHPRSRHTVSVPDSSHSYHVNLSGSKRQHQPRLPAALTLGTRGIADLVFFASSCCVFDSAFRNCLHAQSASFVHKWSCDVCFHAC